MRSAGYWVRAARRELAPAPAAGLLDEPALAVVADSQRRRLDPADPVVDSDVRHIERQEHVRRIGAEDRLDLLVDFLPFLAVELADAQVEQILDPLADVGARIKRRDRVLTPD